MLLGTHLTKAQIKYEYIKIPETEFKIIYIPKIAPANSPVPTPTPTSVPVTKPKLIGPKEYARSKLSYRQYSCLYNLWNRESHWNYKAYNRSSGAYGIPQALPGSKMASAGADWRTNPITQVKWGLRYINARYGSACNAWSFWLSHHWY